MSYLSETTLNESTVEYMSGNPHGELIYFFERFGETGKQAYHGFQTLVWTKTYINLTQNNDYYDTCKVNSRLMQRAHLTTSSRALISAFDK